MHYKSILLADLIGLHQIKKSNNFDSGKNSIRYSAFEGKSHKSLSGRPFVVFLLSVSTNLKEKLTTREYWGG